MFVVVSVEAWGLPPFRRNIPAEILEAKITGVSEAIGNLTERGAIDPVVKVTVQLSESGFAGIQDAFAYGEIKDTSFTGECQNYLLCTVA